LEHFDAVRFRRTDIETFIDTLFRRMGTAPSSAGCLARAVVDTSLRGFDTHGMRLVTYYAAPSRNRRRLSAMSMPITALATRRDSGRSTRR
jgi:LDH2 family malate/lactate/ureidoglycolate dehydrogenase